MHACIYVCMNVFLHGSSRARDEITLGKCAKLRRAWFSRAREYSSHLMGYPGEHYLSHLGARNLDQL